MAEENKIILDADVKPLQIQLKEATDALLIARARFGELSDEAIQAAQNLAGIKDEINGANEAVALFDPGNTFGALTTAASTAAGGIAAVQGAMALFGGESEEVEKALLKVQGAMALSQGLSQLKDIGKVTGELKASFKGLTLGMNGFKKALIGTGIGIFVAALGLLIANFDSVKAAIMRIIPGFAAFAEGVSNAINAVTDFIGITNAADRELEKLTKSTALNNEEIGNKIKLLSAQGNKEKEIFDLSRKQIENELNLIKETEKTKKSLTEEEQKRRRELLTENAVLATNFYKKEEENAKAAAEKAKAEQEKINTEKLAAQKILSDAQLSLLTERQQQEAAINATFEEQSKKLKEAGIKDDGTLEEVRRRALADIDKKFNDEKAAKDQAFQDRLNSIITETRLAGIKDENEKARQELLNNQAQELADLAADTTLKEDEKLAIQTQLKIRNKQELDALELTFAEAEAVREIEVLDKQMEADNLSIQMQRDLVNQKDALLREQFEKGLIEEAKYNAALQENSDARKEIDKQEYEFKIAQAQAASDLLGSLANLAGQQTAAGKALGVSAALVNTYVGVTEALATKSVLPSPFDIVAKIANVATVLASGLKAVRAITAVKVPGGGGGGGGVSAPSIGGGAPSTASAVPTIGSSPVTALGQVMANQPPMKAYVVESEVTGTQKRVADIERRAGF
jgi:hypothetical protein